MQKLALDHMTVVDANPIDLAEEARAAGCDGICLFMQPMDVLPLMPKFELYADASARRALKRRMDDLGVTLELAYPFTLAGRTDVAAFAPALACAAELEARRLNVLVYDRDPARRQDRFAEFCALAETFGLKVALEFYPVSQVRSLNEALELVRLVDKPGEVGINADLLHLMRSGDTLADLAAAPEGVILFGQFADGPASRPQDEWDFEASSDRLRAGDGDFDLLSFSHALPRGCSVSVEIPRNDDLHAGMARGERARLAVESVRAALARG